MGQSYEHFQRSCSVKGLVLPTFDQVCKNGAFVNGKKTYDSWIPIQPVKDENGVVLRSPSPNDTPRRWAQIGTHWSNDTCFYVDPGDEHWSPDMNQEPVWYKGDYYCVPPETIVEPVAQAPETQALETVTETITQALETVTETLGDAVAQVPETLGDAFAQVSETIAE